MTTSKLVPRKFGTPARKAFVDVLRVTGNLAKAARAAGVSYATAQKYKKSDPRFAAEVEDALNNYYEDFENALADRARFGVRKYLWYKGEPVYWPAGHPEAGEHAYEMVYSDSLGPFIARAHRPDRHRDRSESTLNATVRRDDATHEDLAARLNRAIEDARMRQSGEMPDGVKDVDFVEHPSPEDAVEYPSPEDTVEYPEEGGPRPSQNKKIPFDEDIDPLTLL